MLSITDTKIYVFVNMSTKAQHFQTFVESFLALVEAFGLNSKPFRLKVDLKCRRSNCRVQIFPITHSQHFENMDLPSYVLYIDDFIHINDQFENCCTVSSISNSVYAQEVYLCSMTKFVDLYY